MFFHALSIVFHSLSLFHYLLLFYVLFFFAYPRLRSICKVRKNRKVLVVTGDYAERAVNGEFSWRGSRKHDFRGTWTKVEYSAYRTAPRAWPTRKLMCTGVAKHDMHGSAAARSNDCKSLEATGRRRRRIHRPVCAGARRTDDT